MFSPKAKQVMTSFDLVAIIQELNETIIGSRLDNIYQISPLTLFLVFNPQQRLIIEVGKRIHLTEFDVAKPKSPSLFCRILRRHLNGGVVQAIQMDNFERIISIEIISRGSSYELVCEIFGKGNIILIDAKGIILHAMSYRRMRDREIIRGKHLESPPSRGHNPFKITRQHFEYLQELQGEVVQALSKLLAVGGLYVEEILQRAKIDKVRATSSLSKDEVDKIYSEVLNLASSITHTEPHIVADPHDCWIDVLPFPLKKYSNFKMERYETYNRAADEYFTKLDLQGGSRAYREIVQSIEEQKRILTQQKEHLKVLAHEAIEKRRFGDAIYLRFFELQNLFKQITGERTRGVEWNKIISSLKERKDKGEASAILFDSANLEKGTLTIRIHDLCFELCLRRSVSQNASLFYEEAKELEAKMEGLRKAIVETEKKMQRFSETQFRLESEETSPAKIRKRSWFERFHWARSSENFLMIGGRDASTNELLIKKYMNANDFVFHTDISGAPFVVLKAEDKTPSEQTMFEVAQLTASYSRGWREGYSSLDVYWVRPEQVSKQSPSGEYLAKGMFMVRGQRNYIYNVPLRVSIGVIEKEENLLVIGGPVSAINVQTRYKVDIVPGRWKSGRVAKMIRDTLASMVTKDLRDRILKQKIEEIQRFIPPGKSEIAIR